MKCVCCLFIFVEGTQSVTHSKRFINCLLRAKCLDMLTTRHPHHSLVDEPGKGFMLCSPVLGWTVTEREFPVLLPVVHLLLLSLCVLLLYYFTFQPFCRRCPSWHCWRPWKDRCFPALKKTLPFISHVSFLESR